MNNKIRINVFEIRSYRSCINTKLNLQEDLTALIGINGVGKSNILNGMLFLKKLFARTGIISFWPTLKDEDNTDRICRIKAEIQYKGKKIHLRSLIHYSSDEQNNDEVSSSVTEVNYKEITNKDKWVDLKNTLYSGSFSEKFTSSSFKTIKIRPKDGSVYYVNDSIDINEIKEEYKLNKEIINFISRISYYSASQFSDPSQCPVAIELGENRISIKGTSKVHDKFILDLYKSYKSNEIQYKRYLSIVNKEGIGLLDIIKFIEVKMPSSSYKIKGGVDVKTIKQERILIVPVFTIDKIKLSPNQLSEGTFKTLALLFYLLTDENEVLLIEEPEVCVHHGLLNNIISLIKQEAKFKQIIVSTHSDYVLDQLKPENIVVVKKIDNIGTQAKALTKSISKNDYKILRNYLNDSGNLGEYLKEGAI